MNRVVCLALLITSAVATADSKRYPPEPVDKDEDEAKKSALWEKATNPQRKPYEDLLAEAQTALDDRNGADAAKDAIAKLTEAIKLQPSDPRAYRMRGDAFVASKDWAKCATDFADAIGRSKKPDADAKALGDLRRKLGFCQARAGQLADAERTLAEAAASGVGSLEVWVRLGEVRIAMGKLDEAISALESIPTDQTEVSIPLVRFLLMGAYDRARKPAMAADMGHWAIDGNPADTRKVVDREMSSLKNSAMPLLGVGESEYLMALASAYFDPPRPEYGQILFRRFVQLAPDSPWKKRAEEHLKELKGADLPEYVEQPGGSAILDKTLARVAVRKLMPQMRTCLAKAPGMILEITITKNGPRTAGNAQVPQRRGAPPEGTTTTVKENISDATAVDRDNAIRCVEPIADKVRATLPLIKEKDTWYRARFLVVGS